MTRWPFCALALLVCVGCSGESTTKNDTGQAPDATRTDVSSSADVGAADSGGVRDDVGSTDLGSLPDGGLPDIAVPPQDDMGASVCGNGVLEDGEVCDGDCPEQCFSDACATGLLRGSAATCDAVCQSSVIIACNDGDGCCAAGCAVADDDDCVAVCGNGVVEGNELCDGNCPATCTAPNSCTTTMLAGAAGTCDAECVDTTITACTNGDGCCAAGCTLLNDTDCAAICGNGVVEGNETCDGNCPATCTAPNACTTSTRTGTNAACNVRCVDAPITVCTGGDGCCPMGCTDANDADCPPSMTCTPGDFGTLLKTYTVSNSSHSGPVFSAPLNDGGALVAFHSGGTIHVVDVGPDGSRRGTEHTTTGTRLYGLAAHAGGRAVMVSRGSDILALVAWSPAGMVQIDQTILGDVPHDVVNNEWFGTLLRAGRVAWTGSSWATYNTVQRLWPDMVAHYGDTLRYYDATGTRLGGGWGWGCSHSMEVRISHNGSRTGPVCLSDCYPSKGVHFSHNQERLWTDPTANCGGGYSTQLGASVPTSDGFLVLFAANDMRASQDIGMGKINNAGDLVGNVLWYTGDNVADARPNAAAYGTEVLVGWTSAGTDTYLRANASTGVAIGSPATVAGGALSTASDFFAFPNGDTGWAFSATNIGLAVMEACP